MRVVHSKSREIPETEERPVEALVRNFSRRWTQDITRHTKVDQRYERMVIRARFWPMDTGERGKRRKMYSFIKKTLSKADKDSVTHRAMHEWCKELVYQVEKRYPGESKAAVPIGDSREEIEDKIRQLFPRVEIPEFEAYASMELCREYLNKAGKL